METDNMNDDARDSSASRGSLNARTGRVEDVNDVQAGDFLWTTDCANPSGFGFRVLWGTDHPREFAKEREWIWFMMPNVFWDRESMERSIKWENQ
jgi:hypothetical protein